MDSFIEEVLFSHEEIVEKCKELGKQITDDYSDKCPILIGLLKGSVPFMAELMKHVKCDMQIDFMHASSYHGAESTGYVTIKKDVSTDIAGRHIILVEDIVDTGLTIKEVVNVLKDRKAASIEVVSLVNKPVRRNQKCLEPKYVGFTIPAKFIVGFGLDYNELYRNLDYIGVLKECIYKN